MTRNLFLFTIIVVLFGILGCNPKYVLNSGIATRNYTAVRLITVEGEETDETNLSSGSPTDFRKQTSSASDFKNIYNAIYPLNGLVREFRWVFVRGVIIPAKQIDDPALFKGVLSEDVKTFLKNYSPMIDPFNNPSDRIKHGRFMSEDNELYYQLIILRFQWDNYRSSQFEAFRITNPKVDIFASEVLVPDYDWNVDRLNLTLTITVNSPDEKGGQRTAGSYKISFKGINPSETRLDAKTGELLPAFHQELEDTTEWMTNSGDVFTVSINIVERSKQFD